VDLSGGQGDVHAVGGQVVAVAVEHGVAEQVGEPPAVPVAAERAAAVAMATVPGATP
jgi:hypothetical protein